MTKIEKNQETQDPLLDLFKSRFENKIKYLKEYLDQGKEFDPSAFLREIKAEARLIQRKELVGLLEQLENDLKESPRNHVNIQNSLRLCHEFLNSSQPLLWLSAHQQLVEKTISENPPDDPLDHALTELFLHELRIQINTLSKGLLFLEEHPDSQETLNALMGSAHSIKSAARFAEAKAIVKLAHAMEECFTAARGKRIRKEAIDVLLKGTDLLAGLTVSGKFLEKMDQSVEKIERMTERISTNCFEEFEKNKRGIENQESVAFSQDAVLRITPESLNRLMGLAEESLVEAHWLEPFNAELISLGKKQQEIGEYLEKLKERLAQNSSPEEIDYYVAKIEEKNKEYAKNYSDHLLELELFIQRYASHTHRFQSEVIASRMRPFADCAETFPRMIRDLAHKLNKKVHFQIIGKETLVDREILEKLKTILGHLIRNCLDHGIESPEERGALGKPLEGLIKIEAEHRGGKLLVTVSDDGRGMDIHKLKEDILKKKLVSSELCKKLTDSEVLEFLFLPGFTTSGTVTEISGRGYGLNIVQNILKEIEGKIQITNQQGITIQLQLPLSLSVIRALLVKIANELYAFPLAAIEAVVSVSLSSTHFFDNHSYFKLDGHEVCLVRASELLDLPFQVIESDLVSVIVLKNHAHYYGLIVDCFLEEKELVAQEMDPRLGKMTGLSSGALTGDGTPILILDVGDLLLNLNTKDI